MTFDKFKQMIQTFGASSCRWETDDIASCRIFSKSNQGIKLLESEKRLDEQLDILVPPICVGLADRLYAAVVNERVRHQILLFWRCSTFLSLLLMIGGFYLGWYQTHQDYMNTQSYFDTLFDINY